MRERHHLPFEVLSDRGNHVAAAFRLTYRLPDYLIPLYQSVGINLPDYDGDDSWVLPIPARIVVAADGVIRRVDADPDYTARPEPEETIAFLKTLL